MNACGRSSRIAAKRFGQEHGEADFSNCADNDSCRSQEAETRTVLSARFTRTPAVASGRARRMRVRTFCKFAAENLLYFDCKTDRRRPTFAPSRPTARATFGLARRRMGF